MMNESELTTLEELSKLSVPGLINSTTRPPATPLGGRRARPCVVPRLAGGPTAATAVLSPDAHWQALDIPLPQAPSPGPGPSVLPWVEGPSRACSGCS